jgi:hypothetical protein
MRRCVLAIAWALSCAACSSSQLVIEERAREFVDGVGWLQPDVPVALADDGTVAFPAITAESSFASGAREQALFVADFFDVTRMPLLPSGHSDVTSVQVNEAGVIAFLGRRTSGMAQHQGVYTTSVGAPIVTAQEAPLDPDPATPPPPRYNVALTESGALAFSSITGGEGAIMIGPVGGPFSVARAGSGTFFNTKEIDLNPWGVVAAQMEYADPTMGLARGILVFEAPGLPLDQADSAIEKLAIGTQPAPALNAAGTVAFALNGPVTLKFYDPPDVNNGMPIQTLTLQAGVYTAVPVPFGLQSSVTLLADTAGGYASFGRVAINDDGLVVFEAGTDDGDWGVFSGPDPACGKILATGDTWGTFLFSVVRLGELNNEGEVSLLTSDFHSTDRQVWVFGGLGHDPEAAKSTCWELPPPP